MVDESCEDADALRGRIVGNAFCSVGLDIASGLVKMIGAFVAVNAVAPDDSRFLANVGTAIYFAGKAIGSGVKYYMADGQIYSREASLIENNDRIRDDVSED